MSGYTKLFASILESTIWMETPPIKVVWITLLAMADRDGIVEASIPGLAKRAGVERTQCEQAMAVFLAPDPDSRTTEFEGRRIEVVPGGWRLLNYEVYRERASKEDRAEKNAARQRRFQERQRQKALVSVTTVISDGNNDIAEAEAPTPAPQSEVRKIPPTPLRGATAKAKSLDTDETDHRAGNLVRRYAELYTEHRHGAHLRARPNLDWSEACDLVKLWPDDRLEKLAILVLTTDDDWISRTDRSFRIFALKASWADSHLADWEHENGVTA